jgi:hypothetical protein
MAYSPRVMLLLLRHLTDEPVPNGPRAARLRARLSKRYLRQEGCGEADGQISAKLDGR